MCQCFLVKPYAAIDYSELRMGWYTNSDGAGYMFAHDGKLIIRKPFWELEVLIDNLRIDRAKYQNRAFVIHLRLATSGKKTAQTCHPILVNSDLAFIHNGIFTEFSAHEEKSDTVLFNENIFQQLPKNFIMNDATMYLIEEYCGRSGSKLVFLNSEGKWKIVNMDMGTWRDNVWYSYNPNTSIVRVDGFSRGTTYHEHDGRATVYNPDQNTWEDAPVMPKSWKDIELICDVCSYPVAYKDALTTRKFVMCEGCYAVVICSRIPCPYCKEEVMLAADTTCQNCHRTVTDDMIIEFAMKGQISA
jgi:hypothetical protein